MIGLYKTELIRRRGPWRHPDDVEFATLGYVDWFNHRRLHSATGDLPPAEYETTWAALAAFGPHRPENQPPDRSVRLSNDRRGVGHCGIGRLPDPPGGADLIVPGGAQRR